MRRAPPILRRLCGERRATALVEFALAMPLLLGFAMSGLEMANYVLAINKCQRLATMMANLLAQNGDGPIAASEAQVYDLFTALDISARPYDLRDKGRVILTVVKGVDTNNDGVAENTFLNQQFDGDLTTAVPILGCHTEVASPIYARQLAVDEVLIHAQVSYRYATLFPVRVYDMLHLPTLVTRTAAFRARSKDFNVTPDASHPDKGNCTTGTGT